MPPREEAFVLCQKAAVKSTPVKVHLTNMVVKVLKVIFIMKKVTINKKLIPACIEVCGDRRFHIVGGIRTLI